MGQKCWFKLMASATLFSLCLVSFTLQSTQYTYLETQNNDANFLTVTDSEWPFTNV
jgi:hypothetical protein